MCASWNYKGNQKEVLFVFFAKFSWERQVKAALWFYVFTTGAINRRACVAYWLSYLHLPAPHDPGSPNSHTSCGRSQPPHLHFPQHVCDKNKWGMWVCFVVIFVLALSSRCVPPTLSTLEAGPPPKCLEKIVFGEGRKHCSLQCLLYMGPKIYQCVML